MTLDAGVARGTLAQPAGSRTIIMYVDLRTLRRCRQRWLSVVVFGFASVVTTSAAGAQDAGKEAAALAPAFLVIYRPGPAFLRGKPMAEQPLREHGRYMLALYKRGIMRMAGSFADESGGAALLGVASEEQARSLIDEDPAVVTKVFTYELVRWRLVQWDKLAGR